MLFLEIYLRLKHRKNIVGGSIVDTKSHHRIQQVSLQTSITVFLR